MIPLRCRPATSGRMLIREADDDDFRLANDDDDGASCPSRVPSNEEIYASAQPVEIGTRRHARERRTVELACRSFCKCCGGLLRPPDAAAAELAMACVLAPFEIGCAHVTPFGPLGVGRAQGAEKDSWQYIGRVDS